jgi:hypothetical protein
MNITVKDLGLGQGFYLPNSDHKGSNPTILYFVREICEDGIYAQGDIETCSGNRFDCVFWLPNFTIVEEFNLDLPDVA